MHKQYESLYNKLTAVYGKEAFDTFAHFAAMKGRKYGQDNLMMMFIGRATNGWASFSKSLNAKSFGKKMEEVFKDESHTAFDWISPSFTNWDAYNLNTSKFWLYSGEIWKALNELYNKPALDLSSYGGRWFEFCAWSNLYKIAEQGKNPTIRMSRLQSPECMEILREEIDVYSPRFILMEIDESWFTSFSPMFSSINVIHDNRSVKITAGYKDIPVLVTVRPETVRKDVFVSDIVRMLKDKL